MKSIGIAGETPEVFLKEFPLGIRTKFWKIAGWNPEELQEESQKDFWKNLKQILQELRGNYTRSSGGILEEF